MAKNKRKLPWKMQAITSTISTTMVLVLLGTVVLMMLTARVLGEAVKENLMVTVVLDDEATAVDAQALQQTLEAKHYVAHITTITPEQALQEQIESMGLDPTDFLGENPFAYSMELRMKPDYSQSDSLLWISSELKGIQPISDVMYQKELVESLNRNLRRASMGLLAVALLLVVVSLALINNTVRLSVYNHRFRIHTMKLVGARWSFIRRPFLLQSMWIGLLSATLASALLYAGIRWAASHDSAVLHYITLENMGITALAIVLTGLIITVVCTFVSVTHLLRMRGNDIY